MIRCTRCALEIDEEPPPERCPQCGCALGEPLSGANEAAIGRLRIDPRGDRRRPPTSAAGDLPTPVDEDAAWSVQTREFEVAEGADASGVLDLPQASALGQSAIFGRRRAAGGRPVDARELARPRAGASARGRRLTPWLLGGLALLGLGASLTIQRGLGAAPEQVLASTTPPPADLIQAVQKDLNEDTPDAFHRAEARCESAGARACQAEAILLRALRYGPDEVLLSTARALDRDLEERGGWPDPRARGRIRALLALAEGDAEIAYADLNGDDPRERLYRGWAALALGEGREAAAIAERLLSAAPDDPAAALLAFEADPDAPLDDLRRLAEAHRDHPRIQATLIRALIDDGALVEAEARAGLLTGSQYASASYRAGARALEAELLERRGELTAALERYDQARAEAPGRRDLLLRRGRLLLDAGDHTRLRGDLQVDLARVGGDPELVELLVELELRSGLWRAAEEELDRFLDDLDPAWDALLRGRIARARHEDDEALASFARARELAPALLDATLAEAELLQALDRRLEASALLAEARAQHTSRAARRRLVALEVSGLIAADKRDLALEILDRALAEDPGNDEARIRRGVLRGELGLDEAARDDLLRVLERAGPITGLVGPLGREYLRAGDDRAAEALIAASVDDRRATADVTLLAAELAFRRHDLASAESQVRRHLRHARETWRGDLLLAEILEARGELAEALSAIMRARPPRPDAGVELVAGRLLEANGRVGEAVARYRRARHLRPDDEEARRRYVSALLAIDKPALAIAELRPLVAAGDASWELGRLLTRAELAAGERREALGRLDQRLEADPDDREASYWRGVILIEERRPGPAVDALTQALDGAAAEAPWIDDALERVIAAHEALGDDEAAAAARAQRDARRDVR